MSIRRPSTLVCVAGVAALGAAALASGAAGARESNHAYAAIVDASGAQIGDARFVEDGAGIVHVNIKVKGLPAGLHGVHIHSVKSCATTTVRFDGAGGHYNPTGAVHADHAGDLPNLIVNEDLVGRLNAVTDRVTLGPSAATIFDGDGSALIIHANEDDFGPVANGNSGSRIACGVIEPS